MEARLLNSLHHKLDDLEAKIRAYRIDLIDDFQRHYHGLLHDVTSDVASNVHRAIVSSFVNYPTLQPDLESPADPRLPPDINHPRPATFQQGSSALLSLSAHIEPAQGSRERGDELRGLFTPSYLPLIEGNSSQTSCCRPSIAEMSIAAAPAPQTTTMEESETSPHSLETRQLNLANMEPGTQVGQEDAVIDDEPQEAPQVAFDSGPGAKTTADDSTSSVCSDKSDSKGRRSALRRSSSLSKPPQSPRRVRFEFMGAEVLPTASPRSPEFTISIAPSPFPDDESVNSDTLDDGSLEVVETSPPKISSSDALRALSRAPVEDGTVWTVINPDVEESESRQQDFLGELQMNPGFVEKTTAAVMSVEKGPKAAEVLEGAATGHLREEDVYDEIPANEEASEFSEDDGAFLSMMGTRAFRNLTSVIAPTSPPRETHKESTAKPTRADQMLTSFSLSDKTRHQGGSDDELDDDMFHFESGDLGASPKPRQKPPPLETDSGEDSDGEPHETPSPETRTKQHLYATSPAALSMARASSSKMEQEAPPVTRFQPASLGSYKGRPVVMPVVKDAQVYARAASLGKFNTFVGGLDGRSGIDEGDLSSFRNSVIHTAFNGTPRSLTERLLMEEAQAGQVEDDETLE